MDDIRYLRLELLVVRLPAGEVGSKPFAYLRSFPAFPVEQITIKIQRNQRENFFFALLHQRLLFRKRLPDFVVHPPARQGILRAAEQHLVPKSDALVHAVVDVVAGQQLPFVEPAPDSTLLKRVVQSLREQLVGMAVTDEARVELDHPLAQKGGKVCNQVVRQAAATQKHLRERPGSNEGVVIDEARTAVITKIEANYIL